MTVMTDTSERRHWLCERCGAGGYVDEGPNTVRCDDDECPITWAFRWKYTGAQTAGSPATDAGTAGAAAGDERRATQPRHPMTDTGIPSPSADSASPASVLDNESVTPTAPSVELGYEQRRLADLLRRRADVYAASRDRNPYYGDDDIDLLRRLIDERTKERDAARAEVERLRGERKKVAITVLTAAVRELDAEAGKYLAGDKISQSIGRALKLASGIVNMMFEHPIDMLARLAPHPTAPASLTTDRCTTAPVDTSNTDTTTNKTVTTEPPSTVQGDGWRTIDTAPKDNSAILIFDPHHGVGEGRWYNAWGRWGETWVIAGFSQPLHCYPTHWQPLPTPPSDTKGEG